MAKKVYQFDRSMLNMILKADHEVKIGDKKETWRLIEGDSELNIKKQSEKANPKRIRINTELVVFDDETEQKWIESRSDFGTKIRIYDKAKENEKTLKGVMSNMETVLRVSNLGKEEMIGLGYQVFGQSALNMIKEDGGYDGLKLKLLAKANMESDKLDELMDKEKNSSSTWWALAFAKGYIKEDQSGTEVAWGDDFGGSKIISVTVGVRPIDALTEYATTVEGASVKQLIGQKMVEKVVDKVSTAETTAGGRGRPKNDSKLNEEDVK